MLMRTLLALSAQRVGFMLTESFHSLHEHLLSFMLLLTVVRSPSSRLVCTVLPAARVKLRRVWHASDGQSMFAD